MRRLEAKIDEHSVDGLFISFLPDVRWACGFSGSNGLLYLNEHDAHFFSDGRYASQARDEVDDADVHTPGYDFLGYMEEEQFLKDDSVIGFQADHVTVDQLNKWKEHFPNVEWQPISGMLQVEVASKQPDEIERIRKAQEITDAVFSHLLDFIESGMTEKDVAAEIVYQHLKRGADKMSFDPIVAGGPNGALPHARPTNRELQHGELIVIDMGCFLDGYASDMTRTVALGDPGEEAREVYQTVRKAQQLALDFAKAGLTGKEVDAVSREFIEKKGFGDYFNHGLGHGLGLQIHEWPRLSYHVAHDLPMHAAVTVEPGIYLPDKFGVRIEDIIILEEEGNRNLTKSPKELIQL